MRGHYGIFEIDGNEIGHCVDWTKESNEIHARGPHFINKRSDTFHVKLFEIVNDVEKLKAGYEVKLKGNNNLIPGIWYKGSITLEVINNE